MKINCCPKFENSEIIKSVIVKEKKRYFYRNSKYYFTVNKIGKKIDDYYVTKALQLYLEGLSLREIERILGISHVTISSWIKEYNIKKPPHSDFHATYRVFKQIELAEYIRNEENLKGSGLIITEFGDKFMMIKWERFKK